MKKIIVLLICLIVLTSCNEDNDSRVNIYNEMINNINNADDFIEKSEHYSVTFETTFTSDGQRYYIVIDNPTAAMYDVTVLAFEQGTDTDIEFAPNAGIFEGNINMIPNQINKDHGFVKGVSISGILKNSMAPIYCLVQWKDEKSSHVYREYLILNEK